ncbi:carboxypeptidase regulatory-like domain-containing protein [Flavobacterium agricola]|uniref:carboxypeptidase regulatory-like domain-containing protein n=1 Tax=Flavobacterium agricola TaxID=2870839 RepID=UPI002939397C|nr:carboxypeptidase-like regulatory domain-containing protein [Flavobacterium agricola]
MRKILLSFFLFANVFFIWAQQPPAIKGKVIDALTQKPLVHATATILATNTKATTNDQGEFEVGSVSAGDYAVQIQLNGFVTQVLRVAVVANQTTDLGVIALDVDITAEIQLSLVTITETDLGDDNSGSESTSALLQASRDTYLQIAAFNWGQARYRIRGLDNEYGSTLINGISMNKIYDGRPQWGNWGGLNDATRNQEYINGSRANDYTFGSLLGTQEINTRASIYRPGARVSFSGTNTNYNFRTMATYASGLSKKGWAYVISASGRWAKEGFFDGTDYNAISVFASVEKNLTTNTA